MAARLGILLTLGALLSGCAATASNCAGWKAIRPSKTDQVTPFTRQQIIAHNEFGATQGCWTKPR